MEYQPPIMEQMNPKVEKNLVQIAYFHNDTVRYPV